MQILKDAQMIIAFGHEETALVMYETETVPVRSAYRAKCVSVTDGKITRSRFCARSSPA